LGDSDDPTRYIGFDDIISVSPEDVYNVAKRRGMENFCQHYLGRGEGTSIFENGKNTFIHSCTERGDELIQGVFDTLQAAEMSVIESRYNDARRMLNSRKTKSS